MSFYSGNCLASLINLASVSPPLCYRGNFSTTPSLSTKSVINEYFSTHPECYTRELEEFININRVNPVINVFVFIVCYNKLPNLEHIVRLYEKQKGDVNFQVTFLINYTTGDNEEKNNFDENVFLESAKLLLKLKERYNFIHVITKRYSPGEGGLARARKYAMDYSLLACSKTERPDSCVLISNEGDTLEIEDDYLLSFSSRIGVGREYFVQGRVKYPSNVYDIPLLKLYVDVRERVHIGQGINEHRYPGFEGMMPIGRNYGIHPKIACLSGGIDPIALRGAEDDQMLGFDIYYRLGNGIKHYAEDIVLTTNPRREILIVHGLLNGREDDAKSMYEDFHNNKKYMIALGMTMFF